MFFKFLNKCELINLYNQIIYFLNYIFNNLEGIPEAYIYTYKDKKFIENNNLNNLIDLSFYILDTTISYLYEPLLKKYLHEIFLISF